MPNLQSNIQRWAASKLMAGQTCFPDVADRKEAFLRAMDIVTMVSCWNSVETISQTGPSDTYPMSPVLTSRKHLAMGCKPRVTGLENPAVLTVLFCS